MLSAAEEKFLPTVEASIAERRALRVRYESKPSVIELRLRWDTGSDRG